MGIIMKKYAIFIILRKIRGSLHVRFLERLLIGLFINLENYPDKVDSRSLQQYNRPLLHDDAKALNARCEVHESRYEPSEKLYFIRIQNKKISSVNESTKTFPFRFSVNLGSFSGHFELIQGQLQHDTVKACKQLYF